MKYVGPLKRRLSVLMAALMVVSLFFGTNFAYAEGETSGSQNVETMTGSITSQIEITDEGETEKSIKLEKGCSVVVEEGSAIYIESGNTLDLTLAGENTITAKNGSAIYIEAGAILNLCVEGDKNELTAGNGYAGICVEPAYDESEPYAYSQNDSAKLNISGGGALIVTGGDGDTESGTYGGGAGIGGNGEEASERNDVDFGSITIADDFIGTIKATGGVDSEYVDYNNAYGGGAGIGSGGCNMAWKSYTETSDHYWWEVFGNIKIENGTIKATSKGSGAGIGGGSAMGDDTVESSIEINITGGNIDAVGGNINAVGGYDGAGIGGGALCDGGNIRISGGDIKASAGTGDKSMAAGIGGGYNASVLSIDISGGTVDATASGGGAGIGGGAYMAYSYIHYGDTNGDITTSAKVSISGEKTIVTAQGGSYGTTGGAGIGGGCPTANNSRSVAVDISIQDGATVKAYGGYHSQAIGYGNYYSCTGYGITLRLDDTINLWAENDDYYQPALVAATEYDNGRIPVTYSSGDTYLVTYTDSNTAAAEAGSYEADAYLDITAEKTATLNWNQVTLTPKDNESPKGNWATLQSSVPVTISPVSITAYVGGISANGSHAPKLRFSVDTPNGVTLDNLTFYMNTVTISEPAAADEENDEETGSDNTEPSVTIDGNRNIVTEKMDRERIDETDSSTLCLFPILDAYLNDDENRNDVVLDNTQDATTDKQVQRGRYLKLVDTDVKSTTYCGEYTIEKRTGENASWSDWYITAEDKNGNIYLVNFETNEKGKGIPATVTIRDVSEYETMYDNPKSVLTKVVNDEESVNTTPKADVGANETYRKAVALYPEDTVFTTNGKENLGLLGTEKVETVTGYEDQEPLIALLFDDIVSLSSDAKTLENQMISYAEKQNSESYTGWEKEFKYLDLVNVNDGNAVMEANEYATIYWPYPDGITYENSGSYNFQILHYTGMDRSYTVDSSTEIDPSKILESDDVNVEKINVTPAANGLKFTTKSFSPFVLMWETKTDNGKHSGGGGGGGGSTGAYTLTYETNGGTEIPSERVNAGTIVDLTKKVTSRDGYDFGGWYTDAELTNPVSGDTFTVTGNATLYAWWIARTIEGSVTAAPSLLESDDHFAYVVGYTDGLVHPEADITRAEAATIFFRLLKEDVRESNLTKTNTFSDVNEGNWFNIAVSTMANLGIVKGRNSETFDPNAPITRAELAAICARFDEGASDIGNSFSDISGHWAESEIKRAAYLGWIEGYTDGTFRPNKDITRAESMTLINRVLNRIPENTTDLLDNMNIWPDSMDTTRWYYLAVQEATNSHTFNSKNESNETWSAMSEDPDWTRYQ
jgi:uncharacterized repeat protein (TIGR02543 family)